MILLQLAALSLTFLLTLIIADEVPTENRSTRELDELRSGNEIVGVASIAGITSRNGRVSSLGGVRFFPGPGVIATSGDTPNFFYPSLSPKIFDSKDFGRFPLYPRLGSIFSTSEAFGRIPDFRLQVQSNRPSINEFYGQPKPEFLDIPKNPWFQNEMTGDVVPPGARGDVLRNPWFYPNFNPYMYFW